MVSTRLLKILIAIFAIILIGLYVYASWESNHQGHENNKSAAFQHSITDYAATYNFPRSSVSFSPLENGGLQVEVSYQGRDRKAIFTSAEIESFNENNPAKDHTVIKIKKLFAAPY